MFSFGLAISQVGESSFKSIFVMKNYLFSAFLALCDWKILIQRHLKIYFSKVFLWISDGFFWVRQSCNLRLSLFKSSPFTYSCFFSYQLLSLSLNKIHSFTLKKIDLLKTFFLFYLLFDFIFYVMTLQHITGCESLAMFTPNTTGIGDWQLSWCQR